MRTVLQMGNGQRFQLPKQGLDMGAGAQNMGAYQEAHPEETSGSGDNHSPRRDAKGRRRNQTKTERQQMLNKAAQQRCVRKRLCFSLHCYRRRDSCAVDKHRPVMIGYMPRGPNVAISLCI